VAPDIRADTDDERAAGYSEPPMAAAADLFEPKKRRRSPVLTYIAVIAVVALVAAFGVLAMTFHAATTVTAEGPDVAKDPQVEIADLQKQNRRARQQYRPVEPGDALQDRRARSPARRSRGGQDGGCRRRACGQGAGRPHHLDRWRTAAAEAAPPTPRERKPKAEARAAAEPIEKPAKALELVTPITSVAKTPFDRVETKPPVGRAKPGAQPSDADFIANIEKALADAPADPRPAAAARAAPAAVSAVPPPAAPGALAPADQEPGGLAPADATSADALPNDIGPAVRAVPRGRLPADGAPARADAAPITIDPQAAAPVAPDTVDPTALDQVPDGAFDIRPQPGAPVPPEPIPTCNDDVAPRRRAFPSRLADGDATPPLQLGEGFRR